MTCVLTKTTTAFGARYLKEYLVNGRSTPLYLGLMTSATQEAGYSTYARQPFSATGITGEPTWHENIITWPRPAASDGVKEIAYIGFFLDSTGGSPIKIVQPRVDAVPVTITMSLHTGPNAAAQTVSLDF